MTSMVTINERGTLTLPKLMRRKLGLRGKGQVIAEEIPEGIVLKPGAAFPIEIYTDERIAEFDKNIEQVFKKYSFKKQ